MHYHLLTVLFVAAIVRSGQAQPIRDSGALPGRIGGIVEVGGLVSSVAQTPFWLRTNQYGIVPLGGSSGSLRASIFRDYQQADSTQKKGRSRFDWGFGVAAVGNTGPIDLANSNLNDARQLLWPEVFAKVRFGQFELFAGRRREVYGLGDTTLTSGFVAWSGNAIPFPKVQLHTPGFVPVKWLRNSVAFRVGYAHGWFTQPNIQGAMLHQKYLYLRFGKPTAKLTFTTGLNHQVQWGGRADYLRNTIYSTDGQLPETFRDYVSVVLAKYPDAFANDRLTEFDGTNRVGNHVGSIDFAFDWKGARHSWQLYHQHIYEDASGIAFQNVPDGLTGLRWLNRKPTGSGTFHLTRVTVEWLSTTDQSGDTFDFKRRFQGRDNYFNHGQYVQGWSYQGRTIGTPFIAPRTTFTDAVNASPGGGYFPNNRLVMWYAGAEAQVKTIRLTARVAWSRNFGGYDQPFPKTYQQTSAMLAGQGRLPRLPNVWLTASLALDEGEMYPNAVGGFVSLQKRW